MAQSRPVSHAAGGGGGRQQGDQHLHYVNGTQLWGLDPLEVAKAAPTVLGTHPSDLGEERLAHFWAGYFQSLLKGPG
jgi:hypothetical protein